MIVAISTAIPLLLAGVLVIWTAYRAYRKTLPPNFWVGIRTTSTLRSEEAWTRGHEAAAVPLSLGGIGLIAAAAVAVFMDESGALIAAVSGCAWLVIWLLIGSATAARAAGGRDSSSIS